MKVYTKTGDKGETGILGGTRLPKSHIRIEAYGTVDELNSWIGLLRDSLTEESTVADLIEVQDRLFTLGSYLASDPEKSKVKIPLLAESDITFLEQKMDAMDEQLPPMRSFVLPGGHPVVSHAHIARTICRRAERRVMELAANSSVSALSIQYLNRLSDYLFVLSRALTQSLGATEIPWNPRM